MVSASNKTCKEDSNEDSTDVMLDLQTEMTQNKDSNNETTVVIHNKIKLESKTSAHPLTCSYDYSESSITLKTPVGKTHNCSILFQGLKTKKKKY